MGRIFCLIGKSSTGKDTIFRRLIDDKDLRLKPIIPYTTRPRRDNETNGVEYFFIDKDILENYEKAKRVIETREYNTINGLWYYATIDDGQVDLINNNYLVIATLESYQSLKEYFGDDSIVPLYISMDDGIRLERALKREREQAEPNYDELCRRFLADNVDFSQENLESCNIAKYYYNYDLKECVKIIKEDILRYI